RKVELVETFLVDLSSIAANGRDVTFADSQGLGTILNDDAGSLTIDDIALLEGDSGDTVFTFTVTLDAEIDAAVSVNYDTAEDTATLADGDFLANTGSTLSFAANSGGPQTQTFSVVVVGDEKVELNEAFFVDISGLVNNGRDVTIGDSQAQAVITNDDAATLSIDDVVLAEGDSGSTFFTFIVTLDAEVDTAVVFDFDTADDSATVADGDYFAAAVAGLSFAANAGPGIRTQTLSVEVVGDLKVELDETFLLTLSGLLAGGRDVTFAGGGRSRFVRGTMTNDDSATLSVDDVTQQEGDSGDTLFTFTVTLDHEVDANLSLNYSTVAGSATDVDNDYHPIGLSTFDFDANNGVGSQTRTVSVTVSGDQKVERDESFQVILAGLNAFGRSVTLGDNLGLGTILNDDSATISIDDVTRVEGDMRTTNFTFTVTLNAEVDTAVTLSAATAEGTATIADNDFAAIVGGDLTFAADAGVGPQTQTVTVLVTGDNVVERNEGFFVNLSGLLAGGRDVTLADGQGLGTITNDESAIITIDDITVDESNAPALDLVFTVTLNADVDTGVTVGYGTLDDTASTTDGDYSATSGTLSFTGTAGESKTITVLGSGDGTVELDEQFLVRLFNLSAGGRDVTTARPAGFGTLLNDDTASLSINDVTLSEGASGTTDFTFSVGLSGDVDVPFTVVYDTQDGSATVAGNDYSATSGLLTFQGVAGEIRTVTVQVTGDTNVESTETFKVNLSAISAAGRAITVADGQGVGTIIDEDTVLVTISDATVTEGHTPNSSFLSFTVTRDNVSIPIDIDFASADGTATVADGDYIPVSGTLNFPAFAPPSANVVIEVVGDHRLEATETLFANISSTTTGVVITDSQAVGTILQDDGFVSGQKFHDLNGDGIKDTNEPGLDGWVIEILDAAGRVVATGATASADLNGDNAIDPFTERGLYNIPTGAGTWWVREVQVPGWRETEAVSDGDPVLSSAELAYQFDQQFELRFTGNLFDNWGGFDEKWMYGSGDWFFITPDGSLFQWDGSPQSALTGDLVGTLDARFHATPSLLYDARPLVGRQIMVVAGQTTDGIDFSNIPTGSVEGRKWHDINGDGQRDPSESWLNGWTIQLTDDGGNVLATTVTADVDLDGNGQIDPNTERGWYQFLNLVPGDYGVTEEAQPLWSQSSGNGEFSQEAYQLNQERDFRTPANDFLNWGGRNEKWLWSSFGWHFVTPDGSVYEWDGSSQNSLTGRLLDTFNSLYWQDLSLLYNAAQPREFLVTITGQAETGFDFGNTFAQDRSGAGNVSLIVTGPNVTLTGDAQSNSVTVYMDTVGNTYAQGIGQTTVNGQSTPVLLFNSQQQSTGTITAALNEGNDQLTIVDLVTARNLTVQTGAGDDLLASLNSTLGSVNISSSGGVDEVRLHQSQFASLNVSGTGLTNLEDTTVNGDLTVNASGSGNLVFIQQSMIVGSTSI
ncbi:MAG: Calx-beta domain-containing protein, partial [Fuerstiella sp.]